MAKGGNVKGTGSGKGAVKRGRDTEKAKGDGKIEREMNVEKESERGMVNM
jgi:hypothetical protein